MKVVKQIGFDKYGDNTIHHDITLENPINLGNNFTFEQAIEAIKESEEREELIEYIGETKENETLSIFAKGKYSLIELDNYDCDEMYSFLVNH